MDLSTEEQIQDLFTEEQIPYLSTEEQIPYLSTEEQIQDLSTEEQIPYLSTEEHFQSILDSAQPGDMLEASRGVYKHFAIYAGKGMVIHRTGDGHGILDASAPQSLSSFSGLEINKAEVREDPYSVFAADSRVSIKNCPGRLSPSLIVENARGRIGERGYNVFSKNCEHFATGCQTGKESSSQVNNLAIGAGAVGMLAIGGITAGVLVHKKKKRAERRSESKEAFRTMIRERTQ